MKSALFLSILAAAGLAGCYAETGYGSGLQYGAQVQVQQPTVQANVGVAPVAQVDVEYAQPELISINSGVSVVYDAEYPVFFHDNYYWRYDNNNWYRSQYHDRGWAYERNVPRAIHNIDRPHSYSHYRPNGYVSHRESSHYGNVHGNGGYHDTGYHGGNSGYHDNGYHVSQTHPTGGNYNNHPTSGGNYNSHPTSGGNYNNVHPTSGGNYNTHPTNTGGSGYHSTGGSGYHQVTESHPHGNVHSGGSGYSSHPSHSSSRPSHSTSHTSSRPSTRSHK